MNLPNGTHEEDLKKISQLRIEHCQQKKRKKTFLQLQLGYCADATQDKEHYGTHQSECKCQARAKWQPKAPS